MTTLDVNVTVSKETYELGQGLAAFTGAMKKALEDGWQMGDDLPAILASAMSDLVPAFIGIEGVADEIAADKLAFSRALAISLGDIAGHFVK